MENTTNLNINQIEQENTEEVPMPIDSIVDVEVDDGGRIAKIRMRSPLNGGVDVTKEAVMQALRDKNVVFGVNDAFINMVVNSKAYDRWHVIAKSKDPQNGEDGRIEYFFEKSTQGTLTEDSKGFVDFKDIGTVRNISSGTVIANIVHETKGEEGTTVFNTQIKALDGVPPKVTFSENIAVSDDGLTIVATADGNLVWKDGRFSVETVVKIDGDIDMSTGNIEFVGDVVVLGDVKEGFVVTSGKDILVKGGIFSSSITAAGKITVRKGAIGSTLVSGGETEIEFGENSNITCTGQLNAKSLYCCEVYCKGEVFVNKGAGSIIGGKIISTKNLTANSIGSKSYSKTKIVIGENAILLQEKTNLENRCEELREEEEKCTKIVEFLTLKKQELGQLPQDKLDVMTLAAKNILMSRNETTQINVRINEIDDYLQQKQDLSVTCRKELYPGVRITINDVVLNITTLYQYCKAGIGDDGIEINNL